MLLDLIQKIDVQHNDSGNHAGHILGHLSNGKTDKATQTQRELLPVVHSLHNILLLDNIEETAKEFIGDTFGLASLESEGGVVEKDVPHGCVQKNLEVGVSIVLSLELLQTLQHQPNRHRHKPVNGTAAVLEHDLQQLQGLSASNLFVFFVQNVNKHVAHQVQITGSRGSNTSQETLRVTGNHIVKEGNKLFNVGRGESLNRDKDSLEESPKLRGKGHGDKVGDEGQGLDGIIGELILRCLNGVLDKGGDNLKDFRVKLRGLANAAKNGNKGTTTLSSGHERSVRIVVIAESSRKTEEFLGELAANGNSVGANRVLELIDNVVQNEDKVIAINLVDQTEHDSEKVREDVPQQRLSFFGLDQGTESQSSLDPGGELRMLQNVQHTFDTLDNELRALDVRRVLTEAQTRTGHDEGDGAVHVGEDVFGDKSVKRFGKQVALNVLFGNGTKDVEGSLHSPVVFEVFRDGFVLVENVDEHVQQETKGILRANTNEGANKINDSRFDAEILFKDIVLFTNVLGRILGPGSFVVIIERNQRNQHLDNHGGAVRGNDRPGGGVEDRGGNKTEEGTQQGSGNHHSIALQLDDGEDTLEDLGGVDFGEVVSPLPLFLLLGQHGVTETNKQTVENVHTPLLGLPGRPVSRVFEVRGVVGEGSHQNFHKLLEPRAQDLITLEVRGHLQLERGIEGSANNLLEVIGLGGVDGSRMTQKVINEGEGILDQLVQILSRGTTIPLSLFDDGAVAQESTFQHTGVLLSLKNFQNTRDKLRPFLRPIRANNLLNRLPKLGCDLRMTMKEGVDGILSNDGLILWRDFENSRVMRSPVSLNGLLEDNSGEGTNVRRNIVTDNDLEHQNAETVSRFHFFQTNFGSFQLFSRGRGGNHPQHLDNILHDFLCLVKENEQIRSKDDNT